MGDADDSALFFERHEYFRGRATVRLQDLRFDGEHVHGESAIDSQNVARLRRVFSLEGCQRLDFEHAVPIVIAEDELAQALVRSNVDRTALLDFGRTPPILHLTNSVLALHGKHRVEAAKQFLDPIDHWWTVDVYSAILSGPAKLEIRTDYCNERGFSDGEVFRYLRLSQISHDHRQTGRWQARLSESKLKDFQCLFSRDDMTVRRGNSDAISISMAFDDLLPFTGLWPSFRIGTHRFRTLNCDDEFIRYLCRIKQIWSTILGDIDPVLLDSVTVHRLQLLYPTVSLEDRRVISASIETWKLFPNVPDLQARQALAARCLAVDGRILSLYTLVEDSKYIEPGAAILKTLVPRKRMSLERSFRSIYYRDAHRPTVPVQTSDHQWRPVIVGLTDTIVSPRIAYLQLWLLCIREAMKTLKDIGKPKPHYELKSTFLYTLGKLALDLGFQSPQINDLNRGDPVKISVLAFVSSLKKRNSLTCSENHFNEGVQQICTFLESLVERDDISPAPTLISDEVEQPPDHRCGRPFDSQHSRDSQHLYLNHIYRSFSEAGLYPSAFSIERDIFRAFFGTFDLDYAEVSTTTDSASDLSSTALASTDRSARGQVLAPTSGENTGTSNDATASNRDEDTIDTIGSSADGDQSFNSVSTDPAAHMLPQEVGSLEGTQLGTSEDVAHLQALLDGCCIDLGQCVLIYDLTERKYHLVSSSERTEASKSICQNLLAREYFFWAPDENGFVHLCKTDLEQSTKYRLRFAGKKGTEKLSKDVRKVVEKLVELFYGVDVQETLEIYWPFQEE